MIPALVLLSSYLIGGIPFGYLLVKLKTGADVRQSGSGNIGATNVLRTTGRAVGVLTLLLDIGKGYFAVWLAARLTANDPAWMAAAAVSVMLGHAFPVFLKFNGGKAVASFLGAFLHLAPLPVAVILGLFVVVVALSRFISLASVVTAGLFPVIVWLLARPPAPILAAAIFAGLFIIWRHRGNIHRLLHHSEHRFSFGGKSS
ncbi:MAG: glycerol-3-phosphate 1-O-acyltransferase PlsY [Acidobacteria bacterium]|nr:glycerol-3-phosphate 1-O-acyltransferase PlsY [Acidobacteriota bacterium]